MKIKNKRSNEAPPKFFSIANVEKNGKAKDLKVK